MTSITLLLGPPGLHSNGDHPMVDDSLPVGIDHLQLDTIKPSTIIPPKSQYSNSGNPCLDLFFSALPSTPPPALVNLLAAAWSYDPLTTLKLVCNLRGVRGTGKSDKESFYRAALWLHQNHPKTLACNLRVFVEFGCYKDLMEILYRLLEGEKVSEKAKKERQNMKKNKGKRKMYKPKPKPQLPRDVLDGGPQTKMATENKNARGLRKEKQLNKAKKAYERYWSDSVYRFLYDCISDIFAEELKKDIMFLNSREVRKISLASKWCPSIDSAYDKATLISESIARRMFPRESDPEYRGLEEAHYAFRVRDRLRKQVLVPLHKALDLPELYMSSNNWNALPYDRVPSVAMKNYKNHFLRHDNQRFGEYIEDVREEDETIFAGALLPHEIIASLKDADEVAELQWRKMVEGLRRKGQFNNCVAVCDISNNMDGTSIEVCVALGILISELSQEPWKGKMITCGSDPDLELHLIKGDSLLSKTQFLKKMDRGENFDFDKVFDRILQVAVDGKFKNDYMIERIFVFSGMGFDEASRRNRDRLKGNVSCYSKKSSGYDSSYSDWDTSSEEDYMLENDWYVTSELKQKKIEEKQRKLKAESWESMYGRIQRKFQEKGFSMPEIVFWNLNNSPMAVPSNQDGVALVSGFSKNLLELFLDNGGIINPITVMEQVISGEPYQKLSVYD